MEVPKIEQRTFEQCTGFAREDIVLQCAMERCTKSKFRGNGSCCSRAKFELWFSLRSCLAVVVSVLFF